jgi:AraC-like DNA-binding protein
MPLAAMPLLDTDDIRLAERGTVSEAQVEPRRFTPAPDTRHIHCRINGTGIGHSRFLGVSLGGAVHARSEVLQHVQVLSPVQGVFRWFDEHKHAHELRPGQFIVFSPGDRVRLDWRADGIARVAHLNSTDVSACIRTLYGGDSPRAVRFARFAPGTGTSACLRRLFDALFAELEDAPSAIQGAVGRTWVDLLLQTLLQSLPHNHEAPASRLGAGEYSPALRRCLEYLHAHAASPLRAADLVREARVPLRTLQAAFQREFGVGPMRYLRELRLTRAHAALLEADPATVRVTDIAADWGFEHGGKFASAYQARYGELPSATLRRAR